jgi:putative nucleotidyltransferase with HDIG domain
MGDRKEECRILIVDDDQVLCSSMCRYLSQEGITATVASDGQSALQMFSHVKPDVVVSDLRMPAMDGVAFLETIKKNGSAVPVIITTGNPDMASAIRALQNGAYDYLLKPLHLPVLAQKIRTAFESSRLSRENIVLSEIVSLYNITGKLAATHNADALLDVIFRYGLELTGAPSGIVFQRGNDDAGELVYARQRGLSLLSRGSPGAEAVRRAIAESVFSSNKPIVIEDGAVKSAAGPHKSYAGIHALMAVPLTVGGKTVGVFMVERCDRSPLFSSLDFTRIEVIASQAGVALCNADLYVSVNRRLEALKLISSFSEQISSRMDKYELLRLLFDAISEHYPVDVMGFLLAHQKRYEFCYWARGSIDEIDVWEICRGAVEKYDVKTPRTISARKVGINLLTRQQKKKGRVAMPLVFRRYLTVDGEAGRFGVLFTGASAKCPELDGSEAFIAGMVNQIRIALVNAQLYDAMKENYLKTIRALAAAVDAKDHYTRGHSEKVMAMAEELARETSGCDDRHIAVIRDAALLHDIGKIGIPGNILSKPGALSFEEFDGVVKKHSLVGANIVKEVPFLNELYSLILHHHEHYDGSGYPHGLKGDAIPLGARILHIADAFDAMTSDRPYRSSLGYKEAIRRIVADSGKHFDPAIVGVLLRVARRKGII